MTDLTVTVPPGGTAARRHRGPSGVPPTPGVRELSFVLETGRALAVVGEAGSGARECVRALAGMLPEAQVSGQAMFEGTDLLRPGRRARHAGIGTLFPGDATRPHPLRRVGGQIASLIRTHDRSVGRPAARGRAVELLERVELDDPARRARQYPYQLSEETRRRVMIAMAFAPGPRLLIAEDPAEAIAPAAATAVLDLIHRLRQESGTALLLATRDLGTATAMTDEIVMMYAGLPVERAAPHTLLHHPHHPYTKGLVERAAPHTLRHHPHHPYTKGLRESSPGSRPVPSGCPFHPHCRYAMPVCAAERPPLSRVTGDGDHSSACWLPHEAIGLGEAAEALRLRFSRPDPGGPP
ncbi:oligopeptide/dipeptide ABC transporter ATP-binding protein [Sphaerisporangium sp. B11E5]|uniref:oligopeptide/dipeptide ABC transporter ATP-binding protein n=1 Tax=Sphaerisporangium sp. B11E5 TaxID=3153563 RepID=UPI00325DE587